MSDRPTVTIEGRTTDEERPVPGEHRIYTFEHDGHLPNGTYELRRAGFRDRLFTAVNEWHRETVAANDWHDFVHWPIDNLVDEWLRAAEGADG